MARERRTAHARPGLDVPRESRRRGVPRPTYDPDAFGALSERVARFLGTWTFIGYMTAIVLTWVVWNAVAPESLRFDEYPFIFLTLMLSLQASYAAPLILLAQNRQTDRDRVQWEQDRARSERNIADTEYLTREVAALRIALGEVATRDFLRSELRAMLEELEEKDERRALAAREPAAADSAADGSGRPGTAPDDRLR
ncbi:DUF1003 domain-containing protein [Motilibacter deserti]|uniref:DUF1003 domain-containing protein n=1 Tax=Motilibacter deserti TaxID=2714956 RepID=A0ABX0GQU0_9ACTN|nr:DUF1003 domain-containing protein [Motilibacter deserti]